MDDYRMVHRKIVRERGKASGYLCIECGSTAMDWAYQHSDPLVTSTDRPFSQDIKHYSPMCRRCHLKLDKVHERMDRETLKKNVLKAQDSLRSESGEYKEEHVSRLLEMGKNRIETDPEYRSMMQEVGRRNGLRTSNMKRECECGLVTNPGMLSRHMKSKGHKQKWN